MQRGEYSLSMPAASELVLAACKARDAAYAPYSGYPVGAAVTSAGRLWSGCNVENASYPAGVCAERVAVVRMVADGVTDIGEIAVCSEDGATPCGICLQTLLEFAPDPAAVLVHAGRPNGEYVTYSLAQLLPHGFRLLKAR